MRRTSAAVLSATTIVVALGLSGCGEEPIPPAPTTSATAPVTGITGAPQAPLPPPEALTGVLSRLADPAVPGDQKVDLVQYATAEDAAALDRFAKATVDGGLAPLTFQATDLAWSPTDYGDVVATVTVGSANPVPESRPFTFPMQFTLNEGAWQLTRVTADQLLELGPSASSAPPAPAEPPR
ncbi:hypothetical protein L2K20_16480 [Mycobacterium sp. MBM]|nr:hypothetical protein [Mycobacterium sp. MBM]